MGTDMSDHEGVSMAGTKKSPWCNSAPLAISEITPLLKATKVPSILWKQLC
jgi:hypothetical protein